MTPELELLQRDANCYLNLIIIKFSHCILFKGVTLYVIAFLIIRLKEYIFFFLDLSCLSILKLAFKLLMIFQRRARIVPLQSTLRN